MTVPATARKAGPFTGTGVNVPYPFSFKIFATTDVQVVQADTNGVETILSSGYTVTMNADQVASPGGSVTLTTALPTGYKLALLGQLPYDQTLSIPGGGNFDPVAFERELDRILMQVQQIAERNSRAIANSPTDTLSTNELPGAVALALIGWDPTGLKLQNFSPALLGVTVANANWQTQLFSGTGSQTDFVLTNDAGVASNCAVSVGGVVQAAGVNFSYTPSTKTISFLTGAPPAVTNNVVVRYGAAVPQGVIDGTPIGATTPSTGAFTTLSATGNVTLGDASTDTLNVGNGGIIKDASGNVGINVIPSAAAGFNFIEHKGHVTNGGGLRFYNNTQTLDYRFYTNNSGVLCGTFSNHDFTICSNGIGRVNYPSIGGLQVITPAGLGYGVGAGGSVTQATSKSTAVTLNTPTGRITMNNAALAAGATVLFALNNSLLTLNDTFSLAIRGGIATNLTYQVYLDVTSAGVAAIALKNISAGSLSEAVEIQFNLHKGATS
jgi:hypothetical protein